MLYVWLSYVCMFDFVYIRITYPSNFSNAKGFKKNGPGYLTLKGICFAEKSTGCRSKFGINFKDKRQFGVIVGIEKNRKKPAIE